MNIDDVSTTQMLYGIYSGTDTRCAQEKSGSQPLWPPGTERMDISHSGKMQNALSRLSEEEEAEMKAFHEAMVEAVNDGLFDAAEMASDAPEALKTMAEENGLDLEEMLEEKAASIEAFGGTPPPPPPMMYGADGIGISGSADNLTSTLLDTLFSDEDSNDTLSNLLTEA